MLILPIKKKWFDMEAAGIKKEEYREIKPYWTVRILKWLGFTKGEENDVMELIRKMEPMTPRKVLFRNGYSAKSPSFIAECTLSIGPGREEWGAEPGVNYFRFHIKSIVKEE